MSEVEKIMGLAVQLRDAAIDFGKTDDDVYERRSSIQVQNTQQALELALTQLVQDRDAWKRNHAELVHDFLPDFLGCLPACDSFGHSSDCPAVEPMAAQKALLKDRDRLEKERDEAVAQFEAKSTLCSKFHAPVYEENDRLKAANVKLQAEVLRLVEELEELKSKAK